MAVEVVDEFLITHNFRTGQLECHHVLHQEKRTVWCSHIEDFIKEGRDVSTIWDGGTPEMMGAISVPYIPSKGQSATVEINKTDKGTCRLMLWIPDSQRHDSFTYMFLGYVNAGEGRFVFRSMIHDWFQARIDFDEECKSSAHGYAAQNQWTKVMKSKDLAAKLAERWSIFTKGQCLYCSDPSLRSSDDDLIPDPSTSSKPNWPPR